MEGNKTNKKPIRWNVFIPCFLVVGGAAILGIVNNEWLTKVTKGIFSWSLNSFGWLYQVVAMVTLVVVALLFQRQVIFVLEGKMPRRNILLAHGLP